MTEESGVGHLQTLKLAARATSKYKALQPTKLADLIEQHPENFSEVNEDELENLTEGDLVKIAFINKESLWIAVDSVDGSAQSGTVYGKTCEQAMKVHSLQKGQRVCFSIKCITEIQYHSDDEDGDSD